jgi:acetyltransferase
MKDAAMTELSALSDAKLTPDLSADLTTRGGYEFHVRSATPSDEVALEEFFTHVTLDDLRFRFLNAIQKVGHSQLEGLVNVDHGRTENFLAFDIAGGFMVATAMMAADEKLEGAEVAIAVRSDFKHRGISWTLLEHVARYAASRGFKTIESIESRENHQAIELEREMGFKAMACPGEPTLIIVRATLSHSPA